ncbi:phage integrase Arm DNA-binding domain-containing protein [Thioalkalivibrio sp. AKL12]|uniref:phage integrase Arm DNA-binding domain-containing protein n=1 Tax=Thioalkalivibrio sp. AKL12 TaxID=1158159 RepID=UPI0009DA74A5
MSPRPRSNKHRGLPENLYAQVKGGQTYYRYRHPITSKYHGMGKDKREAVRAARILNARLYSEPSAESLVARIETPSMSYRDYVDHFLNDVVPQRLNRRGKSLSPRPSRSTGGTWHSVLSAGDHAL